MSLPPKIGVLLAAGRGERLRPFTDTTPKPLAAVNDQTLLEINMHRLEPLVDSFRIIISWLGEQIQEKIGSNFMGKPVEYITQPNPKGGTLDAFRLAVLERFDPQNSFLVANSDDIRGQKFYKDLQNHILLNPEVPALTAKIEKDETKLSRFGVIVSDSQNNFAKIVEKPTTFVSNLVNIGLYYFPPEILKILPPKPTEIEPQKEEYLPELFNDYQGEIKVIQSDDTFKTVTSLEDLAKISTS